MTFLFTSYRQFAQAAIRPGTPFISVAYSSTRAVFSSSNSHDHAPASPATTNTSQSSTYNNITKDKKSHYNLASFLSYASRANLTPSSTTFVGTHYEYTVQDSLRRLGFSLERIGGRSDFGIDLLGHWRVPVPVLGRGRGRTSTSTSTPESVSASANASLPLSLPVIVQCKAISRAPSPNMVRELEGAFAGAPAAYQAEGAVVGLLATPRDATKGVRDALARSRFPLGFVKVSRETGVIEQLVWNHMAVQAGLEGVGVTLRFCSAPKGDSSLLPENIKGRGKSKQRESSLSKEVVLTWNGEALSDAAGIHTLNHE